VAAAQLLVAGDANSRTQLLVVACCLLLLMLLLLLRGDTSWCLLVAAACKSASLCWEFSLALALWHSCLI
jgi:hypothetical protein